MKMTLLHPASSMNRRMHGFNNRNGPAAATSAQPSQFFGRTFIQRNPSTSPAIEPSSKAQIPLQFDLLQAESIEPEYLKLKKRFLARRRTKNYGSKKMVQYKLPYHKGVKGERKRAMKGRLHETAGNDKDVFEMTHDGYQQFLIRILEYLPREIAALGSKESNRIAEIVAWVNRRYTDDPFSFEECCGAAGVHPDIQKENLLETLKDLYGETFDHYRILRNNVIDAEAGDQRAVDWVLSQSDVSKSFNDCCRALGFNPRKARSQILIPAHMIPAMDDATTEPESIDLPTPEKVVNENQIDFDFAMC